ncbi:MAG: hypothetical protein CXT73_02500 [Methanobacteriota archaeon]|nr:MAG: hypothetical protein CXT73_02500 [Euryarchaeota archaeon]
MKFDKSILFFIILAVALLSTLGMNIKEGLTPDATTHTRKRYEDIMAARTGIRNRGSNTISSIEASAPTNDDNGDDSTYEKYWSERRGIRRVDIQGGDEDLYVLKSSIVPPVCPKCPQRSACPRQKPCPPCPACARCPEPAFTCKKVPNYNSMNNQYLPLPWLSQSQS